MEIVNYFTSTIFSLLVLRLFLLIVFTPFWFVGSMISLLFSQVQRERIRRRWPMYVIFGLVSAVVIDAAWQYYAPGLIPATATEPYSNDPLTAADIAQADAVVEGKFEPGRGVSSSYEMFQGKYGPAFKVKSFVVPFVVASSAKGAPGKVIRVKLSFPVGRAFGQWGFPLKETLLLVLKKDPVSADGFELISQQSSWLIIAHPHPDATPVAEVNSYIVEDAKGFLAECLARPGLGASIPYVETVSGSFSILGETIISHPFDDPGREHALEMGRLLAGSDPEFLALAAKFQGEYGKVGDLAKSLMANAGDTSFLEAGLKKYNSEPVGQDTPNGGFQVIGNNHYNFPWQVANAVRQSSDPGKMMPVIEEALASPDPRMRREVMRALRERQTKDNEQSQRGNVLGNAFYPVMAKMLDDPDREVQYSAMACLFYMSGNVRKRVAEREIHLWAIPIVKQNPDFYVQQYRDWWQGHKGELGF